MIRPFDSGSHHLDWENYNCCRCTKYPDDMQWTTEESRALICPILMAISEAAIGDGLITKDIAKRMGFPNWTEPLNFMWRCTEFEDNHETP